MAASLKPFIRWLAICSGARVVEGINDISTLYPNSDGMVSGGELKADNGKRWFSQESDLGWFLRS